MPFFDALQSVIQHFATNWTYTPVAYANDAFDTENVAEWARFTDNNSTGSRASLGNNPLYRYRGIVTVQLFVKPNIGPARVQQLTDFVTSIFRDQRISGTQFYVPRPEVIGMRDGWYQVNVLCPYYRDEE